MSLLRQGDLSLWGSMLFVEMSGGSRKPIIRPHLNCNRIMRKGTCNRAKCRFSPCVLKDLKAVEWYMVEKCWK